MPRAARADRSTTQCPLSDGRCQTSGTVWRSSLRSGITGILFTQRAATSSEPSRLIVDFWAGVNAAAAPGLGHIILWPDLANNAETPRLQGFRE